MKGFTHKRVTTEKINIKGLLSDDAEKITYYDGDEEYTVDIADYFKRFAGMQVDFTLGTKDEEDLAYEM